MSTNDRKMRLTSRTEWTEEQVKQAIATAQHVNSFKPKAGTAV